MICSKTLRGNRSVGSINFIWKARYSRRSDKNVSAYKLVKSDRRPLDDVDDTTLEANSNWELLAPTGFRFYLPGSVGPGWLDSSTTAQVETLSKILKNDLTVDSATDDAESSAVNRRLRLDRPELHCTAQECPMLLKKGLPELFPGCSEVTSAQLTIITITQQRSSRNTRWSTENEIEKLSKYFVLAASDICTKLKMVGYWADFINPFSGQPYLGSQKNSSLYKTDEQFRCLGFKIEHKNYCKVIAKDSDTRNFVGSLYTTAPSSTDFLKELLSDIAS
ncbi:methylmalonic aciduria and homocystinuria type D homolog, mitochondrial [Orussus abietinus]|uniref:methylmalonic aciduria and homocystinuria type D homolog, mitochondrial n=1 Tax=Orussus abietinus TaxID=222816 RepID=UPI000626B3AC|nr:methylmalonic aciduria and homocystinuria type D homolog, mitochondrial [Orussus abietinus]XP_012283568.1 methylmalonic aciduria and homocystinuria type D homolog, mitochondrial [Orussus abietinus]XP_012283569.1 methylmalonic aciduria and homocystinuria type D homolog, mitochondrial [Orussus abietinus]XP_012283571.1 methylmalonic aciduria and homocystinuria type D homolog, mitochondrial [Orussus abietinus]XP_012283572.1 methylmalonic aciduria and homocystinuria type D homolog, mitochondrial 